MVHPANLSSFYTIGKQISGPLLALEVLTISQIPVGPHADLTTIVACIFDSGGLVFT